jgi:hypothetical protein
MTRMGDAGTHVARTYPRIADIDAAAWDACANPDQATYNPFLSHGFLKALEEAGTTGPRAGWMPQHLVLEDAQGGIAAVMPLYAKSHSQGEYVFDHSWAEALHRAGGRYYPKLQCAVPFTPVPGPRLLVGRSDADAGVREQLLASAALSLADRLGASSLHITFLTEGEWSRLAKLGFLKRMDQQFHWHNRGYRAFDDFLADLASRKRKAMRKERAAAVAGGIEIEHVTGGAILEAHWDAMYAFYMDTGSRKWGRPYLNRTFFSMLGEAMASRCLLVLAKRHGSIIAGALHIIGGDCLYGRYWGAIQAQPYLHFELCYYQAIEFAISHGLARAEAGAQGEHKLARGYLPSPTYSSHFIADEGFRRAVARYLEAERAEASEAIEVLTSYGPFRHGAAPETD